MGVCVGLGRGGQRGKNWDNCNRITIKYILEKELWANKHVLFEADTCVVIGRSSDDKLTHWASG